MYYTAEHNLDLPIVFHTTVFSKTATSDGTCYVTVSSSMWVKVPSFLVEDLESSVTSVST